MARPSRTDDAVRLLRESVPEGWTISVERRGSRRRSIRITAPSGAAAEMSVIALADGTPRAAAALDVGPSPTLVVADWLSERTQEVLRSRGASFIDATGNADVRLSEPGLVIRAQGSVRDPSPKPAKAPTLRGPKAWALLRTLVEVPPPLGVRELAAAVDVDAGYVSRVLAVLEQELLVTRAPRGPVTAVEWEGVLRRCVTTYSVFDSNRTSTWVATGGPERFFSDLAGKRAGKWAITGSFAAARLAPVAAPEIAVIYADEVDRLTRAGRLLATTRGANVIVAEPYDAIVFDGAITDRGETYVSVAQVAMDSLTGNARMPAEGEAVVAWMKKNEQRWRTGPLQPRLRKRSA